MNNYEDKTDDKIIIPAEHISDQYDLRDYFAAKAMQGMSANPEIGFIDISSAANEAYKLADAMLKERDKEE